MWSTVDGRVPRCTYSDAAAITAISQQLCVQWNRVRSTASIPDILLCACNAHCKLYARLKQLPTCTYILHTRHLLGTHRLRRAETTRSPSTTPFPAIFRNYSEPQAGEGLDLAQRWGLSTEVASQFHAVAKLRRICGNTESDNNDPRHLGNLRPFVVLRYRA